jgi:hypothetical protein
VLIALAPNLLVEVGVKASDRCIPTSVPRIIINATIERPPPTENRSHELLLEVILKTVKLRIAE